MREKHFPDKRKVRQKSQGDYVMKCVCRRSSRTSGERFPSPPHRGGVVSPGRGSRTGGSRRWGSGFRKLIPIESRPPMPRAPCPGVRDGRRSPGIPQTCRESQIVSRTVKQKELQEARSRVPRRQPALSDWQLNNLHSGKPGHQPLTSSCRAGRNPPLWFWWESSWCMVGSVNGGYVHVTDEKENNSASAPALVGQGAPRRGCKYEVLEWVAGSCPSRLRGESQVTGQHGRQPEVPAVFSYSSLAIRCLSL